MKTNSLMDVAELKAYHKESSELVSEESEKSGSKRGVGTLLCLTYLKFVVDLAYLNQRPAGIFASKL